MSAELQNYDFDPSYTLREEMRDHYIDFFVHAGENVTRLSMNQLTNAAESVISAGAPGSHALYLAIADYHEWYGSESSADFKAMLPFSATASRDESLAMRCLAPVFRSAVISGVALPLDLPVAVMNKWHVPAARRKLQGYLQTDNMTLRNYLLSGAETIDLSIARLRLNNVTRLLGRFSVAFR